MSTTVQLFGQVCSGLQSDGPWHATAQLVRSVDIDKLADADVQRIAQIIQDAGARGGVDRVKAAADPRLSIRIADLLPHSYFDTLAPSAISSAFFVKHPDTEYVSSNLLGYLAHCPDARWNALVGFFPAAVWNGVLPLISRRRWVALDVSVMLSAMTGQFRKRLARMLTGFGYDDNVNALAAEGHNTLWMLAVDTFTRWWSQNKKLPSSPAEIHDIQGKDRLALIWGTLDQMANRGAKRALSQIAESKFSAYHELDAAHYGDEGEHYDVNHSMMAYAADMPDSEDPTLDRLVHEEVGAMGPKGESRMDELVEAMVGVIGGNAETMSSELSMAIFLARAVDGRTGEAIAEEYDIVKSRVYRTEARVRRALQKALEANPQLMGFLPEQVQKAMARAERNANTAVAG